MVAPTSTSRDNDTIIATTWDYRVKEFADNIFIEYPLFDALVKNKKSGSGNRVEVPIEYEKSATGKFLSSDLETLTPAQSDPGSLAFYDWVEHVDSLAISEVTRRKNSGAQKFFDIVNFLITNKLNSERDAIAKAWWASSPTATESLSIPSIITTTNTTGSVGGISRATNSFWRQQVNSAVGSFAINGRSLITKTYNDCSKGQNSKAPKLILTDQTGFENAEMHLAARERLVLEATGRSNQEIGYDGIKFKNAVIYWDDYCSSTNGGPSSSTDGRWYFLNPEFLHLYVCDGAWMDKGQMIEPWDQFGKGCKIFSMYQLCVSAMRHLGVMSGVTYP